MTLVTWVRLEHAIYVRSKTSSGKTVTIDSAQKHVDPVVDAVSKPEDRVGSGAESGQDSTSTATVGSHTYRYRALTISDARVALFFFFLLQSAFFSTGNIASVSSFSMESVTRLIPVFSPFSQGALLILKLLIPFAIISANLGILNRRLEVTPSALFMVVMSISDVMTLNFFYMVRDEGSWLDIGTTISHFCIASLLCTFVAGLEFLSEAFVSGVEVGLVAPHSLTKAGTAVTNTLRVDAEPNGSVDGNIKAANGTAITEANGANSS